MGTSQTGLWTMTVGEREASLKALEDAIRQKGGSPRQIFDKFRTSPVFARSTAQFLIGGAAAKKEKVVRTKTEEASNIWGLEDWQELAKEKGLKLKIDKQAVRAANQFPWGWDILKAPCPFHKDKLVGETHFAFWGYPLSIMELQELFPRDGQPRFYSYPPDCWYKDEEFAVKTRLESRWHLLLKEIVPQSESKIYEEQLAMLPAEYEPPKAVAETAKSLLCQKKTGVYLNSERYGRTDDSARGRLGVGRFGARGLDLSDWWGDRRHYCIGLAASRKFPK